VPVTRTLPGEEYRATDGPWRPRLCAFDGRRVVAEPLSNSQIPKTFLALLARGKSKREPAYGALGGRQVGTCTGWPWGFGAWLVPARPRARLASGAALVKPGLTGCAARNDLHRARLRRPQRLSFKIKVFCDRVNLVLTGPLTDDPANAETADASRFTR
jgi:hypothetical protein